MNEEIIYEIIKHAGKKSVEKFRAQKMPNGYITNMTSAFSQMIRDAARCNNYCCDVYYDIKAMNDFLDGDYVRDKPFLIGYRKDGVDSNAFIEDRCKDWCDIYKHYFALHSFEFEEDEDGDVEITFTQYYV